MSDPLIQLFAHLLEQHGVPHSVSDDSLHIPPLALTLKVFPVHIFESDLGVQVTLAVEGSHVSWPDEMIDTLLGFGDDVVEASVSALSNWLYSTFIVLTAFLAPQHASAEVYTDEFSATSGGKTVKWKVFASPLQTVGNEVDASAVRDGLSEEPPYQQLIPLFADQELSGTIYWSKVFAACRSDQEVVGDCWLNNEKWQEGLDRIQRFAWPPSEGMRAFRQFMVFVREDYSPLVG
jgi:hypothetical protein